MVTIGNQNRTNKILDSAATLIARYSYDKTTVSEIADEAGISKGAVYLEFRSKDELLGALLIREMRRLMEDTRGRIDADPGGGTISGIYRHSILALANNPLMCALYTKDSRVLGDYIRRQPPSRYTERFLFGRMFVERMQEAGLLRDDLSPELTAYLMSIISYGLMSIETVIPAEEAPPLEEVAQTLSMVVERSFGTGSGDSAAGKRALTLLLADIERQYERDDSLTISEDAESSEG
jgi:AcrR family transcriptional regulator